MMKVETSVENSKSSLGIIAELNTVRLGMNLPSMYCRDESKRDKDELERSTDRVTVRCYLLVLNFK
jgi:hypothetical protein